MQQNSKKEQKIDFHGAAIIDDKGEEIDITESMVQDACQQLDSADKDEDSQKGEN